MAQIPTPPLSRESSVQPVKVAGYVSDDKVQQLDKLLEHYLQLIDRHQKLQEQLGKNLSSGVFSLTYANYCSPTRRFGEDYYDERMKATRRLEITSHSLAGLQAGSKWEVPEYKVEYESVLPPKDKQGTSRSKQETEKAPPGSEKSNNHDDQQSASSGTEADGQEPEILTPSTSSESQDIVDNDGPETKSQTGARKPFRSDDPISWYGILVPPSLRSAQKSFTEAIDSDIPQLASVLGEMRCVENLVRELRKEIEAT
ncbi:hypothetical protein BGW36DRAFT_287395 [Talaromyces proteolyticus]|uniref:Vacuolar ATPase assembly protein VMA22 n=1 Tax=Talaromyces proteolyticus TaxID=1131652 RepID=A0AAD4Q598_9EURO|nr:uncharacterized protein BGW36DRAFT_287395 [Talaromyces proteolyticus]KAH8703805.1 hypothetical protein BGW36DRAFT_287395 [Talaromyces proteolyticus]